MALDVLVVDDETDIREIVSDILKDEGFNSRSAANSSQAFQEIEKKVPNAIILDIWLQGSDLDGLGILEVVKRKYPIMPVIVISGHGTIETAVSAIKMGAYDYLEKPFTHDKLMIVLKRACEAAKLRRENIDLKAKVIDKTEFIGNSGLTVKLKTEIERVAPTSGRVMICGGVGTGKELVARIIHKKSKKSNAPFIVFSPTSMSPSRVQQELFGEVDRKELKNMVTEKRLTILEAANNGTLYIDEVADLPITAQNKLLAFLKSSNITRNGKTIKLDVRLITSSTKDLQKEITQGNFRQDLYYRLNVVSLVVPLLVERNEDVPLLIRYFVRQLAKFSGLKEREFSSDAIATLQSYNWPGNIRQLRNVIEWTLIMNPLLSDISAPIRSDMLPKEVATNTMNIPKPTEDKLDMISLPLRNAREAFEKEYLKIQLNRCGGNISKTASFVGMERSALHRKLKLLGINEEEKNNEDKDNDNKIYQENKVKIVS